jgi:pimeloyl-ACP methyl ester carboxylesterase
VTNSSIPARKQEKFPFPNARGEQLAGRLELPVQTPRAYALFAHCFTCSKDIGAATRITRALAARGFGVLRFDFTGLGNSEGDFANTNFSSNVDDLVRAAGALRSARAAPQLLIGHSLGGAAVLAAAGSIPEVRGVVTIAAPSDPAHVSHLFGDQLKEIEQAGQAQVNLAGRKFTITRQFVEDINAANLRARIRSLSSALLILHSPQDEIVAIDHARHIYEAAHHPKSFVSLDGADHLISRKQDADYAAEIIAAWANRYILPA